MWGLARIGSLLVALCLAPAFGLSGMARAGDVPIHLVAEEVGYDEDFGLYVARGKVEAKRGERIIMADVMAYNDRTKTVTASGNVVILQPNGDTIFGSYADATEDFSDGFIQGFKALLRDKARLAAAEARRVDGNTRILKDAVYTPCLPCKTDPSRQPIWQVKAREVINDEIAQTITYHNAWMEMFGVPVFWTPYFRHPEPGVKRQSGLLAPTFRYSSSTSGLQVSQPYFQTLGPDKDLTVTPILRWDGGPEELAGVGDVEYRQRVRNGGLRLEISGTVEDRWDDDNDAVVKRDQVRGHIEGDGLFEINRDWRWGFNSKVTADKSYLGQYHFGSPDWLENQLWAEGFFGRSYFDARAFGFQTTEQTLAVARQQQFDDDLAPVLLPSINYNFVGEPSRSGAYWGLDVNAMNLMRREERDSLRFSVTPSWTLPYTSSLGDIYELKLLVQSDLYVVNGVDPQSDEVDPVAGDEFDGVTGRVFPVGSLKWRYPFVSTKGPITQVFQPIAQLVMAPDWGNSGKIPNEDSRSVDWDDARVFDPDRLAGLDRVDSGSRINYGAEWTGYFPNGGSADLFLGQSLRFLGDGSNHLAESGIEDDLSDLVGRVTLAIDPWITASYRFDYDVAEVEMRQQSATLTAGPSIFQVSAGYQETNRRTPVQDTQQISGGVSSSFLDGWSANASAAYDIESDRLLTVGGGVGYQDECFGLTLSASYVPIQGNISETEDDFTAMIQFRFTNLGSIGSEF